MKLLKNKFTETAILLPIVAILAVSGYYFYMSYTNYNHAQKSLNYVTYKTQLDKVLNELGKEQGYLSIYLGMNGKSDFKYIKNQWETTQKSVDALQQFVEDNTLYGTSSKPIFQALDSMNKEHSTISVLNANFIDLYFKNPLSKPNQVIVNQLQSNEVKSTLSDMTDALLNTYTAFSALKENTHAERALVSYFVSRSMPISGSELEFWDQQIAKDNIPIYSHLIPQSLISKLNTTLNSTEYRTLGATLLSERISIISNSHDGNFDIDLTQWYDFHNLKITLLEKAQKEIINTIKININTDIKAEERIMTIAMIVIFIFLLLALFVRNIFSGLAKDSRKLEHVLKSIETNAELDDEYNLSELIESQDKTKIYQFLEKTIIEAKESKRLAEKANNTKSLFLANMSHEIRTPLNGIVGFTDILKQSDLNSEQREFVQIIEKSSENLLSVINDILDLSKIESEKIEIEDIEFDPIIEFESGIESYGAKAAQKNINLGFYIDPYISNHVKGDPNKIKQVLVNLISNAVKFTPEGGEINILIEKVDSNNSGITIKFSVHDSGIGVTDEQKIKIFEAFSQADSSTNRKFGGTGLGLTISKRLIQLMGGNLDLESTKEKGSTFFFTLNFEEVELSKKTHTFENLTIGYYLPEHDKRKESDIYIWQYISALAKHCHVFHSLESLMTLPESDQPDLLFVNYDYISDAELMSLSTLKSKISLLSTVLQKDEIKDLDIDIFKLLYAPVNFTKIKNSILDFTTPQKVVVKENTQNKFRNLHVLVAEDNTINQKLIKHTLENIGLTITLADNGKEALELRCTQEFDVIFMDIQMPIMNGIEATHAILKYEETHNIPHVPIIALTANALKGDKARFLAEGMDEYISKPIKLDVIVGILTQYFKDNLIEKSPIKKILDVPTINSVDILLCKQRNNDMLIFSTLLKKIGYSVNIASNIHELKEMIQKTTYKYVLLDKELQGLAEDESVSQMMKDLSIQSILFVEHLHLVTNKERTKYTRIALNVPNMEFLRNIISKLNPKEYDKFTA